MRRASLNECRWLLASGNESHCPFVSSDSFKFQAKHRVSDTVEDRKGKEGSTDKEVVWETGKEGKKIPRTP